MPSSTSTRTVSQLLSSSFIDSDSQYLTQDRPSTHELTISLQKVGQNKECYLWQVDKNKEFMAWWEKTGWYFSNNPADEKMKYSIRWGSKKTATVWNFFDEGALVSNGGPRVICQRCLAVLKHSSMGIGTKPMDVHLDSKECRKRSKAKGLEQLSIREGFRGVVGLTNIDYHKDYHKG